MKKLCPFCGGKTGGSDPLCGPTVTGWWWWCADENYSTRTLPDEVEQALEALGEAINKLDTVSPENIEREANKQTRILHGKLAACQHLRRKGE